MPTRNTVQRAIIADELACLANHVRCVRCGRVDDVMIDPIGEDVNEAAAKVSGYRICGHSLQFDGVCPACQQESAPTDRGPLGTCA